MDTMSGSFPRVPEVAGIMTGSYIGGGVNFVDARDAANARLIASLRALRPSGRIVLQLPPEGADLPPLALEDGDRLFVPGSRTEWVTTARDIVYIVPAIIGVVALLM